MSGLTTEPLNVECTHLKVSEQGSNMVYTGREVNLTTGSRDD